MEYRKERIKGFEKYQIDTKGIVYGQNGHPMSPSMNPKGYLIAHLSVDGKEIGISVHTLVAKQFLEKSPEATQVNHISGDKTDNSVENLEWVTAKENMRHSVDILGNMFGEKNHEAVGVIGKDKHGNIIYDVNCMSDAAREIAEKRDIKFNSAKMGIWKALSGERKSYLGLIWSYK